MLCGSWLTWDSFEVGHKLAALLAQGPEERCPPATLKQEQIVKGLPHKTWGKVAGCYTSMEVHTNTGSVRANSNSPRRSR